jgi:hypothetical protein
MTADPQPCVQFFAGLLVWVAVVLVRVRLLRPPHRRCKCWKCVWDRHAGPGVPTVGWVCLRGWALRECNERG